MTPSNVCARCGGSRLETGELKNARGDVALHLSKAPWLTLLNNDVDVHAEMCLDCGNIQLTGDVSQAREVLKLD